MPNEIKVVDLKPDKDKELVKLFVGCIIFAIIMFSLVGFTFGGKYMEIKYREYIDENCNLLSNDFSSFGRTQTNFINISNINAGDKNEGND